MASTPPHGIDRCIAKGAVTCARPGGGENGRTQMPEPAGQRISVVIPTYNRAPLLAKTLELYCRQTYPFHQFEINVVDDGSTDETEAVAKHHLRTAPYKLNYVRLIHAGPASARNKGIELSTGERVLFTGDDIFPEPDLVEQHVAMGGKYPDCAVLGFVPWSPDLELNDFMRFVAPAGAQFDYSDIEDPLNCGHAKFYGANVSVPMHWIRNERFDEKISSATVEDHEYGYRLEKRGMKIVYNPNAVGYHYHPMTLASFLTRLEAAGKAISYLWEVHPELEQKLRPFAFLPMGLLQSTAGMLAPTCGVFNRGLSWRLAMMSSYLKGIRTGRQNTNRQHTSRQDSGT